jgi:hypothetical protein
LAVGSLGRRGARLRFLPRWRFFTRVENAVDETSLAGIERRQRRLLMLASLAVLLAVGPFVDWIDRHVRGETAVTELRVERILVGDPRGGSTVEITPRGLKLIGSDPRETAYLAAGTEGLSITEPGSSVWVRPGAVEVDDHERGRVELKHGLVMLLGGAKGQTDMGPGFVHVSGPEGITGISGAKDRLGLRVTDSKTEKVQAWPQ